MRISLGIALATLGLALVVACNGDDATSTPEATLTPEVTATPEATPSPSPSATAPLERPFLFCTDTNDDLVGFTRQPDGPYDCAEGGFTLESLGRLGDGLAVGDFVPWCLQPAEGGMRILVRPVCVEDGSPPRFTADPRPPELASRLTDGDLIPDCAYEFTSYPDYPITVGPPCILRGGTGFTTITTDLAAIEGAADCTAGFTYFSLSTEALRSLLAALPEDTSAPIDESDPAIAEAITTLRAPAPERVARFFENWGKQSPIAMNAEIAGDHFDSPALRTRIEDAIGWYTAGRGC